MTRDQIKKIVRLTESVVAKRLSESESKDFYRLSNSDIGNGLYVTVKNLLGLQSNIQAGNDYDPETMQRIIKSLQAIDSRAKLFKSGSKIPKEYDYSEKPTRTPNNTGSYRLK